MLLEASDVEIFAVKVEVDIYFEMEEVLIYTQNRRKKSFFPSDIWHYYLQAFRRSTNTDWHLLKFDSFRVFACK